jgi:transposase
MVRNLRIDSIPPPENIKHWWPRHKAAVVLAVRQGVISRSEAQARYRLSEEELSGWEEAFDRDGLAGLQAKRRQRRG